MSIDNYAMFPKYIIAEEFKNKDQPDFSRKDNPHGILADLDLPTYITTNLNDYEYSIHIT